MLEILLFVYTEHVKFQGASFNSNWDIKRWNKKFRINTFISPSKRWNKSFGSIPSPHPVHDKRKIFGSTPSPHPLDLKKKLKWQFISNQQF